jgi:hypothetical protein
VSIFITTADQQKKLAKTVAALRGMPLQDLVNELIMEEARRVLTPDQLSAILRNGAVGESPPLRVAEPSPKAKAAQ